MSKENNVIGALVMLNVCPGKKGCSHYCSKCDYNSVHGKCYETMRSDCEQVLMKYSTSEADAAQPNKVEIEQKVTAVLHYLGVPASILGYRYVRSAIVRVIDDYRLAQAITKELYPAIAVEFGTTASRAERAIRHAIEIMWDRCDIAVLHKLFGHSVSLTKGRPTNSEFISIVAETISNGYFDHLYSL